MQFVIYAPAQSFNSFNFLGVFRAEALANLTNAKASGPEQFGNCSFAAADTRSPE
jgi:hypothetical protein